MQNSVSQLKNEKLKYDEEVKELKIVIGNKINESVN